MSKIFTKTYSKGNIQEIHLDERGAIIFSDAHCNIRNIKELQQLYPNKTLISLGDACFLFSKKGEKFNSHIINFFIESKIPNILGNHCSHVLGCSTGDSFTKIIPKFSEDSASSICDEDVYDLTQQQIDYLRKLPVGIKLILPSGEYYLLYHNLPNDLWGFYDDLNANQFQDKYPIDDQCLGVISGHLHKNLIQEYKGIKTKRYVIGQLCGTDHHTGENTGGNYAILNENGIEFKKLP